jgi:hypothetical protein
MRLHPRKSMYTLLVSELIYLIGSVDNVVNHGHITYIEVCLGETRRNQLRGIAPWLFFSRLIFSVLSIPAIFSAAWVGFIARGRYIGRM